MKKLTLPLALCGLAALALGSSRLAANGPPEQKPAAAGSLIKVDPSTGYCRILLIHRRQLASDIPGVIGSVGPREGDAVKKGELVAKLRDEVAAAELAVAEKKASSDLAIQYAQKARDFSVVDHKRQLDLKAKGATSSFDVERAEVVAQRSEIEVEQAREQRELDELSRDLAQARLAMYHIESPLEGVVTSVYKYPGEAVRQGDPILEIVSTDRVRVEGYVRVDQAVRIRRGSHVEVRIANLDPDNELSRRTFEGSVAFVDPTVSSSLGVRVWAEVPNKDGALREGLSAYMTIDPNRIVEQETTAQSLR